jgi:hypothetical protein
LTTAEALKVDVSERVNCGDAVASAPVKDKGQVIDVDAMEE